MTAAAVPPHLLDDVAEVLAACPRERRVHFDLRLQRWWDDLLEGLELPYGDAAPALAARVVVAAARAFVDRDDDLHRLDLQRLLAPDWLQQPGMLGYAAYTERFAGDLAGVVDQLDHLDDLGVTYLHLMPLLAPRDGADDGGYAVADFRSVRPDLGSMDDLRSLATTLRSRGISLVLDLVLNHVASDHRWARGARGGDVGLRDYFHVFDDRVVPDLFEHTLPEVFPDFAPGNFTFDDGLDGWVWTTFNDFQWDLDWANPDVFAEFVDIVLFLANVGVEVLRLDAIAFLWKRMGTNCQGQPEVFAITQALRAVARMACPAVAFKAEAIVAPDELVQYLGTGRHTGKVSDLAYHNSLMVQVWSMLAARDVRLFAAAMDALPTVPATATWITYLRCHDDIGWAIGDADAAAVGLDGHLHRGFLSDWYTGQFPGSTARGLVFQHNPQTGDRRVSGTAASLVGLEAAVEAAHGQAVVPVEDPEVARRLDALRVAHAVVMAWGGIPVVWSGEELAQPNDPDWADDPAHADDNRWTHRPFLDRERQSDRHDRTTVAGRAFTDLAQLAAVRARLPQLHAATPTVVGPVDDPGVLVAVRDHPHGRFVAVHNVTPTTRRLPGWRAHQLGIGDGTDELTGESLPWGGDAETWGDVVLAPYSVLWVLAAT